MTHASERATAFIATLISAALMVTLLSAQPALAGNGKNLLSYVPQDTQILISMDMERLRSSELYKTALDAAMQEPDFKEFAGMLQSEADLDISKDVSTVIIALPGDVDTSANFLLVAEGDVNQEKVLALFKGQGAKMTTEKAGKQELHIIDNEGAIAFKGDTVVFGTKPMVEAAFSGKSVKKNKAMGKLVKGVEKNKDLWMAAELPASLKTQMGAAAKDLETVTGRLDLQSGLGLKLAIGTSQAKAASQFAEMINAQVSAVAGSPEIKQMGLEGALKSLKVSSSGKTINVSMKVDNTELETVLKMFQ